MPWWGDVRWVSWDVLTGPLNALDFISCGGELVVVKWWWWYFLGFSILPSPSVIIHVEVRWLPWEVAGQTRHQSLCSDGQTALCRQISKYCFCKTLFSQTSCHSDKRMQLWRSKNLTLQTLFSLRQTFCGFKIRTWFAFGLWCTQTSYFMEMHN